MLVWHRGPGLSRRGVKFITFLRLIKCLGVLFFFNRVHEFRIGFFSRFFNAINFDRGRLIAKFDRQNIPYRNLRRRLGRLVVN